MTATRQRPWLSGLLVVIGGGLVVAAAFMPWFDTGGINMGENDITGTPAGLDLEYGMYVVAAGAVVAGAGLIALLFGRIRRVLGVIAILGAIGVGVLVWPVWDAPEDAYRTFVAAELGVDAEDLDSLGELFEAGLLDATLQPVVYGAVAGAALALIGGLLLLFGRNRSKGSRRRARPNRPPPQRSHPSRPLPSLPLRDTTRPPSPSLRPPSPSLRPPSPSLRPPSPSLRPPSPSLRPPSPSLRPRARACGPRARACGPRARACGPRARACGPRARACGRPRARAASAGYAGRLLVGLSP